MYRRSVRGLEWALAPLCIAMLAIAPMSRAESDVTAPKAVGKSCVSPAQLKSATQKAYREAQSIHEGKNADYIPALAQVDPHLFGVVVVTVDGHVASQGDVKHLFSIQSISKPFVAAELMSEMGPHKFEETLGVNATGRAFNSIEAIEHNKAVEAPPTANPLVNAGAIATVANLKASSPKERWDTVARTLNAFAGRKLSVNEEVYRSEAATNTRNRSIAELLKAYEAIPGDPTEALDVYTRQCSVAVNTKDLAIMGATLASGGVNPLTGQQVISKDIAAKTLAVMLTAGLYEDSGQWAFDVGAPAKSGVGGGIVAVVPGKYAIAAFSPPLDKAGNSVRAQHAIASIIHDLNGNLFEAPQSPPAPRAAR